MKIPKMQKGKTYLYIAAVAIIIAIVLLIIYLFTPKVQVVEGHTPQWKVVPFGATNFPTAKPGDTLVFSGNYTYFVTPPSGTKEAPLVLYMQNANFKNGLDFKDAAYMHITGDGTDSSNYTFRVIGNGGGVPLSFQGKSHDIEIDHVFVQNVAYFVWFKDESSNHPCDTSAYVMNNFNLHDFYFDTAHQDGLYLLSTNEGSQRFVTCNGVSVKGVEYTGSNIRVRDGVIKNCQRQGINYSNVSGGDSNYIRNVRIENCGYEWKLTHGNEALYQGAGIGTGQYVKNLTISGCTIKNTFLPNITCRAGGNVRIFDNILDSADYVWGTVNPQQNAALQVTGSNIYPSNWKIYNNQIGWANNDVQMVLYKSNVTPQSPNDTSCVSIMAGDNLVNQTGKVFNPCTFAPPPPKDTTVLYFTFDYELRTATFFRADGSKKKYSDVDKAQGTIKKKWTVTFSNGSKQDVK